MKIFLALLVVTLANAAKLPTYIQKCKKDDADLNACITKSANAAWPTIVKGDKNYHIREMAPLEVKHLHINVGGNLKANFTDGTFSGMEDTVFNEVDFDFDKKTIDVVFTIPRLNLIGNYEVNGMLLFLPIEGSGDTNVTFVNMKNSLHCEYQPKVKNGKHYVDIKKEVMTYTLKRAHFRLNNLFGGNEQLGEAMNKVLDESWEPVNAEIGARLGDALGQVYSQIAQEFFQKVPIEDLFE